MNGDKSGADSTGTHCKYPNERNIQENNIKIPRRSLQSCSSFRAQTATQKATILLVKTEKGHRFTPEPPETYGKSSLRRRSQHLRSRNRKAKPIDPISFNPAQRRRRELVIHAHLVVREEAKKKRWSLPKKISTPNGDGDGSGR
jgi:hypothetical protein